ncbi:hypothetical protein EDF62_1590 [Leucobacter luti]|uniref:Uncharacterized protein n=1 Tax=Leucobacter luti TaxID=340320 RepID=A0A4R6RZJ1_9MICO|nr:hypothetical protein [Leucobacter luti]TDP92383.1 hypothetical protein EDF62_1590 [Leucobacter luti]
MQKEPTLDCQACGATLKALTPAQTQAVAENPYNFVAYCHRKACTEQAEAEARAEGLL